MNKMNAKEIQMLRYTVVMILLCLNTLFAQPSVKLTPQEQNYLLEKQKIIVNTEQTWKPYNFVDEGEAKGFTNDLMRVIAKHLNIQIEFVTDKNWRESLEMLEGGQIDIVTNIAKNAQREKIFKFTQKSIFDIKQSILSKQNYKSMADLKHKKVGIIKGYFLEDVIKKEYSNVILVTANSTKHQLEMLINGELDAVINDYTVFNNLLKPLALQEKYYNHILLNDEFTQPLYMAVNKNNDTLLSILNKAINALSSYELNKLFEKWEIYNYATQRAETFLTEDEKALLESKNLNLYLTNWEPFVFTENQTIKGISVDIWERILSGININTKYIFEEKFSEALRKIEEDSNGVIIATSWTQDRDKKAAFSRPYLSFPFAIATLEDKNYVLDFASLKGKRIAVGKDFTTQKFLTKFYPDIELVLTNSTLESLDLVVQKKVFAAADILPVLSHMINKYGYNNLKIGGTSNQNFDVQVMVNKEHEDIIPILNKLIASISFNEKQSLVNHWLYSKEVVKVNYTVLLWVALVSLIVILILYIRQRILEKSKKLIDAQKHKYHSFMNLSSDMIYLINYEGKLLEYSRQTQLKLGYDTEEMKHLTVFDFDKTISRDEYFTLVDSLSGEPTKFDSVHTKKDGTTFDVEIIIVKLIIEEEEFYYATVRDITEYKKRLKRLEESEFRWKYAVDGSGDGLWDWNIKNNEVYFSKRWKEMLGFKEDEVLNDFNSWKSRVHPDDVQGALHSIQEHLCGKSSYYSNEHRIRSKSGEYIWVLGRGVIVEKNEFDEPLRMIGTQTDITLQKALIHQLEVMKLRFENMFKAHNSIMLLVEPHSGKIIDANESAQAFYGYTHAEFKQLNINDINVLSPDETLAMRELAERNNQNYFEFPHKLKNGEVRMVEVHSSPIDTQEGKILFSIIKDITEIKRQANRIEEQKKEFETVFNYSKDGIAILDLETNFLNFNDSYLEMSGFEKEELLQKNCIGLTAKEDISRVEEALKQVVEKGYVENFEKSCILKDDKRVFVNVSMSLLPDKKRILMIAKDTSELKLMQEKAKLASMGEMIGNIAHQWRQPLSVITTSASGLKMQSELDILTKENMSEFIDVIMKQSNYLSQTIENFKNFIKSDKTYREISIKKVLDNTLQLVDATLHNNFIEVILDTQEDMTIFGSVNELSEAFINIINNSKDALKRNVALESDKFIFIKTLKIDETHLEIQICDSAGGIDESIINKVLEPYFTTKHQSQGTGLGLSISDRIIREMYNGTLKVSNKEFEYKGRTYKGACFSVILSHSK